jgi:peroxiredoxin
MNIIYSKNTTWFKAALVVAGIYHIFWGLSVVIFPLLWFNIDTLPNSSDVRIWQMLGLYEIVFGFGYLMASSNPLRHWRIVFLGLITKLFICLAFAYFHLQGDEPLMVYNLVLSNYVFWLIPFLVILYNAYKHQYLLDNEMIYLNNLGTADLLDLYNTNKQQSLNELSDQQPILLIFLRHFGCTFCKETLLYINKLRPEIEAKGTKIVLVHMHDEEKANEELKKYSLTDLDIVSDPESMLYKGFHLKRGTLSQVIGFKVWIRGIYLWITKRAFISNPEGVDVFQMPGIFLVHKGEIMKQYIHNSVADVPPYLELATCNKCE